MLRVPHSILAFHAPDMPQRGATRPDSSRWLFDTDAIRVEERPEYWRHAIAHALNVDIRVEPLRDEPFDIRMALQDWGELRFMHVQGSAHRSTRRGPGRSGELALVLQLDGVCEIGDRRRRASLGPGDIAIMPPDFECVHAPRGSYRHVLVDLGLDLAGELLPQWKTLIGGTFAADHPAAAALVDLARWMLTYRESLPDEAQGALATTLLALVPRLSQASAPVDAPASTLAPIARAQRQRVEAFIREHLADAALDVARIARELGLSVRYVHKLFACGPGVMQWVQEQRLLACHDELTRRGTRPVSSIAYGWGFASPSHFSRAFRRRFGVSPSQV
ncbi:MAG TPA: helix-turn-helix domain-containing protein [Rubrivivax sp.]|nr:helix-turn-helix domain-containing protein [Rubrivivax sp.]